MRRATAVLSVVSVLLAIVCLALFMQNRRDALAMNDLQLSERATRTKYDRALREMGAIQDSLNAIAVDAAKVMSVSSIDAEQRLSPTGASATLERIAGLRTRIQSLEARLEESGVRIAGLDKMVNRLKQDLTAKAQQVAHLNGRVDSLQTNVNSLTASVEQSQALIAAQADTLAQARKDLGTVYYVIGSQKDLVRNGVVAAGGGILGLGKTLRPTGRVVPEALHAVDTDEQTVIPLGVAKARVLTAQSPASYSLELKDGQLELHILDRREFCKMRHLVIVTA